MSSPLAHVYGVAEGESTRKSTEVYGDNVKGDETSAVSAPRHLTAGHGYYIQALEVNRQGRDALSVNVKGGPFTSSVPIPVKHDGKTVLSYEASHEAPLTDCVLPAEGPVATTFQYHTGKGGQGATE